MKLKQLILFVAILLASCFISFTLFAQIPASGLVAYWPMNGNYTDAGPFGINGTNAGTTATADKFGVANRAMDFNNPTNTVSQVATHPVNSNLNFAAGQNFTVAFLFFIKSPWVHTGGLYDNCLNYNGYGIWIRQNGGPTTYTFQFNYRNGSLASSGITIGLWQHVTFVRNGGVLSIYLNGVLNSSGPEGTGTPSYPYPARFGTMFFEGMSPANYNPLHGRLDEFRIYNRALSALEITNLASVTLPLVLTDLSAVKKQAAIQLNWATASEQNTSHFEVERSSDGINFSTIGQVTAAGQSNSKKEYVFNDTRPMPATNFYRLRMVDIDNKFTLTRIVAVKNSTDNNTIQLFPNPVTDLLQLQIPASRRETATLSVSTLTGQVVYQRQLQLNEGNNAFSIPAAQFAPGQYYIIVNSSAGRQSLPFVKK